jgi:hypothetical protein
MIIDLSQTWKIAGNVIKGMAKGYLKMKIKQMFCIVRDTSVIRSNIVGLDSEWQRQVNIMTGKWKGIAELLRVRAFVVRLVKLFDMEEKHFVAWLWESKAIP